VHPNPRVAPRIRDRLEGRRGFLLVPPMSYPAFVRAAADAALIISDSGGVQEEAPHLGTPVLVPRANTERPEAVATGFVRLIAADRDVLVAAALTALAAPRRPGLPFDAAAPFGAGGIPLYRISVRVDGPQGAAARVQALLRDGDPPARLSWRAIDD